MQKVHLCGGLDIWISGDIHMQKLCLYEGLFFQHSIACGHLHDHHVEIHMSG